MGTSGQASSTEGSADSVGEALGEGLSDSVGSALALAPGDALRELDGRGDALGDTDSVEVADGAAETDGLGSADVTLGVAVGDRSGAAVSLGAAEGISPERPLSAASRALLAMALGNDDASALALDVAVADGDADSEVDPEGDAEVAGEALRVAEGDADADADATSEALGEIVDDGEAVADGDALVIGSTTQGSCGALICSEAGAGVSAAIAAEPVPNVAKIRLAETVMATPPVRRTPRLRAWLRDAERRERADTWELLIKREWIHSILTRVFGCSPPQVVPRSQDNLLASYVPLGG